MLDYRKSRKPRVVVPSLIKPHYKKRKTRKSARIGGKEGGGGGKGEDNDNNEGEEEEDEEPPVFNLLDEFDKGCALVGGWIARGEGVPGDSD